MSQKDLFDFAKILSGHFSNEEQAKNEPRNFAHINIYFQPLSWHQINSPAFYSEQSFNHDPWTPYRQGVHRLSLLKEVFLIENYECICPERIAGGGFKPDLLTCIKESRISKRIGCAMHFRKSSHKSYTGLVEPGQKCIINRNGKASYLSSKVIVSEESWESLDRGFSLDDNSQIWGSENGPLYFLRKKFLGEEIIESWKDYV